jgi:hypothetical protein
MVCNGLNLSGTGSLTNNKKISNGFGNFSQIQTDDFFPFFFLNGIQDGFKQFAVSVDAGNCLFRLIAGG